MRLWLGAAFAGVSLVAATSVYLFVQDSSGRALRNQSSDLAAGRTASLARDLEGASLEQARRILKNFTGERSDAYYFNDEPSAIAPADGLLEIQSIEGGRDALATALGGRSYRADLEGDVTVAASPIFGRFRVRGAVVTRSLPPPPLTGAIEDLRGDSLRALGISIAIGILIGFAVASLISTRVKRLAGTAEQLAAGRFDARMPPAGGDEIGDLTRSLDTMREALRDSFEMLATERDRLSAILEGLTEAVIVVGEDGSVRFTNPAADELVRDGQPASALIPVLRRASEHGSDQIPALALEGRVYGVQGRRVPAEHAVLLVVRDRTEELNRARAEREFVSNAAHELRNPLAGISSAVEVLRGGAKDDSAARDRFLDRLAEDAERMTRLIQSLLALARVEAVGEREGTEVVDVSLAAEEALNTVEVPEGIEVRTEIDSDLAAEGDPVLLRQVLVGLLSNAYKNTPPPGTVTLRALADDGEAVRIEVEDTGKGIPQDEQARVFERFYRGSAQLEGDGFGLGLPIAKRMVDVMGGQIGLRSAPGQGTTFWVRMRVHQVSATPVA